MGSHRVRHDWATKQQQQRCGPNFFYGRYHSSLPPLPFSSPPSSFSICIFNICRTNFWKDVFPTDFPLIVFGNQLAWLWLFFWTLLLPFILMSGYPNLLISSITLIAIICLLFLHWKVRTGAIALLLQFLNQLKRNYFTLMGTYSEFYKSG